MNTIDATVIIENAFRLLNSVLNSQWVNIDCCSYMHTTKGAGDGD